MKIVGCDLHTRYQQIAMLEQETGELIERRGAPFKPTPVQPPRPYSSARNAMRTADPPLPKQE